MKTKTIPNKNLSPLSKRKSSLNNVNTAESLSSFVCSYESNGTKPALVAGFFISCRLAEIVKEKTGADEFKPSTESLEKMGLSLIRYNKVFAGRSLPSLTEAVSLSRFFDCELTELVNIEETNIKPEGIEIQLLRKYG